MGGLGDPFGVHLGPFGAHLGSISGRLLVDIDDGKRFSSDGRCIWSRRPKWEEGLGGGGHEIALDRRLADL